MTEKDTRRRKREEYKPSDGVYLDADLPADQEDVVELFEREPIVYEMVRQYAREHDCSVDEVLYGAPGDAIHAGAPQLGLQTVASAARAQRMLNEALGRYD